MHLEGSYHRGAALWMWDPEWPDRVHPFTSAIDTPLPESPERTHMMLGSKAAWVNVRSDGKDNFFDDPQKSLAEWHQRFGLEK